MVSFVSPPLLIRQPGGLSRVLGIFYSVLAVVLRQKKATTSTVWPTHRGESRERCTVSPLQFHAARRDPARFLRCRSVCNRGLVGQAPRILAEMLAVVVVFWLGGSELAKENFDFCFSQSLMERIYVQITLSNEFFMKSFLDICSKKSRIRILTTFYYYAVLWNLLFGTIQW